MLMVMKKNILRILITVVKIFIIKLYEKIWYSISQISLNLIKQWPYYTEMDKNALARLVQIRLGLKDLVSIYEAYFNGLKLYFSISQFLYFSFIKLKLNALVLFICQIVSVSTLFFERGCDFSLSVFLSFSKSFANFYSQEKLSFQGLKIASFGLTPGQEMHFFGFSITFLVFICNDRHTLQYLKLFQLHQIHFQLPDDLFQMVNILQMNQGLIFFTISPKHIFFLFSKIYHQIMRIFKLTLFYVQQFEIFASYHFYCITLKYFSGYFKSTFQVWLMFNILFDFFMD